MNAIDIKPIPTDEERTAHRSRTNQYTKYQDRHLASSTNQRAVRLGVLGTITEEDVIKLKSSPCYYCNATQFPIEIDHIIPMSKGGVNDLSNVVSACKFCNKAKHDYTLEEFREWLKWIKNN